jgi:hypothetical protein
LEKLKALLENVEVGVDQVKQIMDLVQIFADERQFVLFEEQSTNDRSSTNTPSTHSSHTTTTL